MTVGRGRRPDLRSRAPSLVPAAIVAVGALGCLYRIGAPSFWLDEAISVGFARLWWDDLWGEIRLDGGNQALYYIALSGWRLAGDGEVWLRLLSVVFALASLAVFYRLAVRLFGSQVARVALALMAVNPFFVRYSREVRAYSLLLLLVTASTLVLHHAVTERRRRYWLGYGLLAVASVWTHLFSLFFLAGQAVAVVAGGSRQVSRRTLATVAACITALALPAVYLSLDAGDDRGVDYLDRTTLGQVQAAAASLVGDHGRFVGAVVGVVSVVGVVAAVRAVRRRPGTDRWPWSITLGTTVVPVALALLAIAVLPVPALRDKYLLPALPGACLLASVGLTRLRWRWLCPGVLCFILAVSAWRIVDRSGDHHQGENWRGIVDHVLAEARPDDRFVFHGPWMSEGFKYYLERAGDTSGRSVLVPGQGLLPFDRAPVRVDFLRHSDLQALCGESTSRIWLVVHDARGPVSLADVEAALGRTHRLSREQAFSIVRVRLYQPTTASEAPVAGLVPAAGGVAACPP